MARSHSSCVKSSRTPETRSFGLIGRRQTGQIRSFLLLAPRGAARSTKIHPPPARRIPVRLTSDVSHGPVAPLTLPRCQATQVKLIFVDMGRATIPIKLHVHLNVIAVYGQVTEHTCCARSAPAPHSGWSVSGKLSIGYRCASFGAEAVVGLHRPLPAWNRMQRQGQQAPPAHGKTEKRFTP